MVKSKVSERYSYDVYSPPPALLYATVVLVVVSLVIGVYSLVGVNDLKIKLLPRTVDAQDFLGKLTSHVELSQYSGVSPQNVVQINQENLGQLSGQIAGLGAEHVGKFLVQYPDRVVLYDYDADVVEAQLDIPSQPTPQDSPSPNDFFTRLAEHPEAQAFMTGNPVGGRLDQESLTNLQQQFPEVYSNAKVGDYLLRFPTGLVVYNYDADNVVTAVPLR